MKKRNRNQIQSALAGLARANAVPATITPEEPKLPVPAWAAGRNKEFQKFAAKEAAKEQARRDELSAPLRATVRQFAKVHAEFWSRPLNEIAADGPNHDLAFFDLGLPKSESNSPEEARVAAKVFKEFVANLPSRSGYTINKQGALRLGSYGQVQALNNVDVTSESLRVMFNFLVECFAPGELGFDLSLKTPEPEDGPSLDEIFATTSGETREGDAALRRAVSREVWENEIGPLWRLWHQSLADNFGGFVMSEAVRKKAYDCFLEFNLAFRDRRSYDKVRRTLVSRGYLPPSLLTPEELLIRDMNGMDLSSRDARIELGNRMRLVNG